MTANIARQRRVWGRRAAAWDHHASSNPGLVKVVERVIEQAAPELSMRVVDLGCGSGQLDLRLAPKVSSILAVDVSTEMIKLLLDNASAAGVHNIEGRATPIERLHLDAESVDLVVSNYALHHLRDSDKSRTVREAASWLRPGGRLVVGDMMFGRGSDADDREIIASKFRSLAKMGPGGWWRIVKNGVRYIVRVQERPVSMQRWIAMFQAAGLKDVAGARVVNEAAVVTGAKPVRSSLG